MRKEGEKLPGIPATHSGGMSSSGGSLDISEVDVSKPGSSRVGTDTTWSVIGGGGGEERERERERERGERERERKR